MAAFRSALQRQDIGSATNREAGCGDRHQQRACGILRRRYPALGGRAATSFATGATRPPPMGELGRSSQEPPALSGPPSRISQGLMFLLDIGNRPVTLFVTKWLH
jgi:hypothetical protein